MADDDTPKPPKFRRGAFDLGPLPEKFNFVDKIKAPYEISKTPISDQQAVVNFSPLHQSVISDAKAVVNFSPMHQEKLNEYKMENKALRKALVEKNN